MTSLVKNNNLCIADEGVLVPLFERYLKHRESLPLLAEEDKSKDVSNLTEEELKARTEAQTKAKEEETKAKEDEVKAKADAYTALSILEKHNHDWAKHVDTKFHLTSDANLKINRLSKDQKRELFLSIRYSFMKHEDLLALMGSKSMELAKDFIIEALSVRLNPYENAIKGELKINTEPRVYYE